MTQRLAEKVCLITGAGSGMGKSHAQMFAQQGAKLVLTDLNEEAVKQVAASLECEAIALKHDVSQEDSWSSVIDSCVEQFGRLDVLVNNAGVLRLKEFEETSLDDLDFMLQVNTRGTFIGCQQALKVMEKQQSGSIINISSIAAVQGMTLAIAYGASKGAVAALTKGVATLCRERANGVRCNSVHPDGVKTPMITGNPDAGREEIEQVANISANASARICEPEDISSAVLFLATDESRFVNGLEFMVDNAASITPPPAY